MIWSGVPDAFDREQPLYAEAGDETYECSFSTWHSAWVGNIPQEWQGRLVTLAQGSLTVQTAVCAVDGTPLMADWLMPEGPVMWRSWLYSEEITVVLNGQTYEGSVDEYTNITWDVEPPVTWPGPGGTEIIPLDSLTTGSGDTYCGVIHSVQGA